MPTLCVILAAVLPCLPGLHGELHEKIEALTRRIEASPQSAILRLERAELFRLHHDFAKGLLDCAKALELDPKLEPVRVIRARIHFDTRNFTEAEREVTTFLAGNPEHAEARLLQARTFAGLSRPAESEAAYDQALPLLSRRTPDIYIERAREQAKLGEAGVGRAIAGLDRGLADIGPAMGLDLVALELEIGAARFDAALARVDRLRDSQVRKETWWLRHGEICLAAGRQDAARESFQAGLDALEKVSVRVRKLRATILIEEKLRTALRSIRNPETR